MSYIDTIIGRKELMPVTESLSIYRAQSYAGGPQLHRRVPKIIIKMRKWLKSDPEASWEKLAAALTLVGHESTAAAVTKCKFSSISSKEAGDSKEDDKIRESDAWLGPINIFTL